MTEEFDYVPAPPKFSGKFQSIFPDGTIQYDDQIGDASDFPLTEAELAEYARATSN